MADATTNPTALDELRAAGVEVRVVRAALVRTARAPRALAPHRAPSGGSSTTWMELLLPPNGTKPRRTELLLPPDGDGAGGRRRAD
ncbi:MAG: hypothetical protein H7226_03890 [Salinibacterium sp.]|nr:hypothetical protein [Salinibacterium sp.]